MAHSRHYGWLLILALAVAARRTLETLGLKRVVRALNDAGAARLLQKFNNRYNQVAMDFQMSATDRMALQEFYADDIRQLEALVNRDLAHWMRPQKD